MKYSLSDEETINRRTTFAQEASQLVTLALAGDLERATELRGGNLAQTRLAPRKRSVSSPRRSAHSSMVMA